MNIWQKELQNLRDTYQSLDEPRACNCIGPQNGQPKCPCMMRNVRIIDGEYVQITRLGKVK